MESDVFYRKYTLPFSHSPGYLGTTKKGRKSAWEGPGGPRKPQCLSFCARAPRRTGIAVLRGKPSTKRMRSPTRWAPAKPPKRHVKHQSPTAVLFTPDATSKRLCPMLFLTRARISQRETLATGSNSRFLISEPGGSGLQALSAMWT